ncbi:phosphatidylserine synthase-like [Hetaerina americana]|uniref:phosphatidylserine synthase-like n=1 Tax=Hetaerina americana TaxID=62018 RepID=UPI003A7F21DE
MGRFSGSNPAISETPDSFSSMNERPVDDISLEFFYKPHTVTLLTVSIASVIYTAFTRNDADTKDNIWAGMCCVVFFFLIVSVLAFPNGPFVRPHPAVWRMVFGLSVLYLLALLFLLFQRYSTVRGILVWMDPKLQNFSIDMEKEYGVNCSDITWERVWSHVDVFAWAHFLGWIFKAVLVRHFGILWTISVMWEFTEIAFAHLLPNFVECWWDALVLDILLCNGLGIWVGLWICRKLEMREYKWVSIKDIHSTGGKIKRAVLQFTPESWTQVRWLDPASTYMRFFAVTQMVVFWQVSELNTFFLKHVFEMPPSHPLVVGRLIFIGTVVAPSVRQYYTYVTDSRCRRVGTQCWVYGAIMFTEAVLCIKNGLHLFGQTQVINIILWLLLQFALSVVCVYSCLLYHRHFQTYDDKSRDSSPLKSAYGSTSHLNQLQPKKQQQKEEISDGGLLGEAEVMTKAKIPEHLELRHRQRTEFNGMLVQ